MMEEIRQKMRAVLDHLKIELSTIRTGRANPALVENISTEVYGTRMPLIQLATISTSDPQTLLVTPFDATNVTLIAKAIMETNLGLMPAVDGQNIRLVFPQLTEERRQEYIKFARTKLEAGKVQIRQVRHEAMEKVEEEKRAGKTGENETQLKEKEIQKVTDAMIAEIEEMGKKKEEELLRV